MALTVVVMIGTSLPNIPRAWVDFSNAPWLDRIDQFETYGPDTISDMYVSKVVLNDPLDMYTKANLAQTPIEAATWSKAETAPYPPVVLLTMAGLYAIGDAVGVGYYGMILTLAVTFLGLSLSYFRTRRWYVFPLLYLNFVYFSYRFVFVQDGSYLVMLVVIMGALLLARARHPASHALMAVAATMKLSPIYYAKNVFSMTRPMAVAFVSILAAGLVLPYFIWENYLYIYQFGFELRGDWSGAVGALAFVGPFALLLAYVEMRSNFDWEDRIGWGLVPCAMFLALKLNAPRHLLIVLLVPDKRGLRNVAAAVGLMLHALFPSVIRFGSVGPIVSAILLWGLIYHVRQVGWDTVRDDLHHPARTARALLGIDGRPEVSASWVGWSRVLASQPTSSG